MAAKKKAPLKRKPQDEGEAKLLADLKDPGWHVIGVTEDEEGPGFVYTIGLFHNYQHPEIIAFGLDVPILWQIVNVIGGVLSGRPWLSPVLGQRSFRPPKVDALANPTLIDPSPIRES